MKEITRRTFLHTTGAIAGFTSGFGILSAKTRSSAERTPAGIASDISP
jgi:hypothetical protein